MAITSILRDTNNNVSIVRIISSDNLATVGAANYIKNQQNNINELNSGPWNWFMSDMLLIAASNGDGFYTFTDGTFSSLAIYGDQGTGTVNAGVIDQLAYYASTGTAVSGLATGNNGVLVTNGGGVPSISSTLPNGLAMGTPASLVLTNATGLPIAGGGTGDSSFTAYAVVCGGTTSTGGLQSVSGLGTTGFVLTSNGAAALPSWQASSGGTPAALTKVDDTNVTLALGGTPATALLQAVSITAGWTGTLSLARGGSAANLTASAGSVVYSSASAMAFTAAGSSGQLLASAGTGAPVWTTSTYPDTNAINTLLYASSANVMAALAAGDYGVLISSSTGVPSWLANGTTGQVLTATTSGIPSWAAVAASSVTFTGDSGTPFSGAAVTVTGGSTGLTFAAATPDLTLGGLLALASGGTNHALTASNGGIVWSDASKLDILAGTATAGQLLLSGSSATPAWSTSTYPATNAVSTLLYASSANVMAALATGNDGVLITSNTGVPSWLANGTAGFALVANSGAPPSWQAVGGTFTPSALTKTDDTNVTLTLGGTPSTALLQATSITAGWTGTLALARGGLAANLTASNGGIFYSTASAGAILAGTATANQILMSGSSTTPAWSTATYPATTTINQLLYSSASNVIGGVTAGNYGVLISSSAGVPSWLANGTTGQVLTATTSGIPSWAAAAASSVTFTGDSGTPFSGAAVTVTGGSTGLTFAAATPDLTLGGLLALASGGTNHALTASNGGIVWSDASKLDILAGTATAGQLLTSGASATPAWTTSTYPATNAVSTLLYASSANVMGDLATVNSASLSTNATGVPTWLALTDGQVVVGSSAGAPLAATLSAGTGVSITNGHNTITIAATGSGLSWSTVTGTSQAAVINSGYFTNNAGLVTVTLPATAAVGSIVEVAGQGAGGWKLAANTSQTIQFGSVASSSAGSFSSTNQYDTIRVVCQVANTTWQVLSSVSAGLTQA